MSISVEAPALANVTVAEAMSPGLLACEPGASLHEAAAMMAANEVHAIALHDGTGVVTAHDVVAASPDTAASAVAQLPATVFPANPLSAAARVMGQIGRSHAFVLDPDSTMLVGMVSTFDVAAVIAGRDPRAARIPRPRAARPAISTSRLEDVTVGQAMHPGLFTCPPGASLRDLAAAMIDHRVHMLLVGDAVVDDIALARAAAAGETTPPTRPIESIDAASTLADAAAAMTRTGTSHLLVTRDGKPAGVLSTFDVVEVLAVD